MSPPSITFSSGSPAVNQPSNRTLKRGIMSVKTLRDSLSLENKSGRKKNKESSRKSCSFHSVSFGKVAIQEHEIIVGDNPSCSNGAPISLGWNHGPVREYSINDYEEIRERRCFRYTLKLSAPCRHQLLMDEWGVTMSKIMRTAMEVADARNERRKSAEKAFRRERSKEAFNSAYKSIKRAFKLQRPPSLNRWRRRNNIKDPLEKITSNFKKQGDDDHDASVTLETASSLSFNDSLEFETEEMGRDAQMVRNAYV